MSNDTPPIPEELRDRLRAESAEDRADLEAVWDLLATIDEATTADPETAWDALIRHHPELDATPTDGQPSRDADRTTDRTASASRQPSGPGRRPRRQRRRTWGRAAVGGLSATTVGMALAVVVLVGTVWWWHRPVRVTSPAGQQRMAALPDGSTVELNSRTTLSYRRGFQAWPFVDADRRAVRLDGEAFFEVTEGERPFTVETTNAQATVLGTRFNVRARTVDHTTTNVTVVRGRVRLAAQKRPEQSVLLSNSGQTSRVTDPASAPTPPESTDVTHVLAWRNDGFSVRARPLSAVIEELELRYDTPISLHRSVNRPEDPVSLYYPGPTDLETILHDLCTARDLNYRPTSRGFEVFAGPIKP